MKILIGITQDLASEKSALSAKYNGLGTSTEVGPFKTKKEAEDWKEFMVHRRENYEEIQAQATAKKDGLWFGFTVEKSTMH